MNNLIITQQIGTYPVVVQRKALNNLARETASNVIPHNSKREVGGYSLVESKQTVYPFVDREDRNVARLWLKIHAFQTGGDTWGIY